MPLASVKLPNFTAPSTYNSAASSCTLAGPSRRCGATSTALPRARAGSLAICRKFVAPSPARRLAAIWVCAALISSRRRSAACRWSSANATLRLALISTPLPSLRSPAASVAWRSPPCAPIPGTRNQACGAAARTAAMACGKVAPTTSPTLGDQRVAVPRHMNVERLVWLAVKQTPIGDLQLLKLARPRIGGVTQHKQSLIAVTRKRLDAVLSQIGAQRNCVDAQLLKGCPGIGFSRAANIPTLGVEHYGNMGRDKGERAPQCIHPLSAQGFVKGDVGLVGADKIVRLLDNRLVPRHDCG